MSLPLKIALGPLLLAQALHTRRRLPKLTEAGGPRQGRADVEGARADGLSLLVLGDSSAAGVGVDTQDQALAAPLARALARRSGRAVRWQLRARSGVTTAQTLALLQEAPLQPAPVAVLVSGVNDVVDQVRPARAVAAREAVWQHLRQAHGARHLVLTAVPPMHRFAGLPQPLRWVAGRDARAHDQALARWAAGHPDVSHLALDLPLDTALLAADGFHPGAEVYRLWAEALAAHIAGQVLPLLDD